MRRGRTHLSAVAAKADGRARRRASALVTGVIAGGLALACATPAHADEVASSPKGLIGGALLGAEVVTMTESIAGAHAVWWYGVGAPVGAAGGAVGGYFLDKAAVGNGMASMGLLAGGLALVIPALVLTLNATRYQGSESATEDKPPVNEPVANPGVPGGSMVVPTPKTPSVEPAPPGSPSPVTQPPGGGPSGTTPPGSLLDIHLDGAAVASTVVRFGVPVPDVRPMYTVREQQQYGLPQRTEVRMPVLAVTF
jgi:hypothetical protein